ncbi:uncharacterized protein [Littorina saxatilis]|uniref:Uncharacterized protein n=1 Tax=Littorina saxatilis TaxID=31220 RepID=A0AAN9BU86_9CAEN
MAAFFARNHGYQIGLLLMILGLSLYILGLSAPYWTQIHYDISDAVQHQDSLDYDGYDPDANMNTGLWKVCNTVWNERSCASTPSASAWYKPVQVLQVIALVGYLLAACFAVVINFRNSTMHNRWLEKITGLSSLLGLIGLVIYVSKTQKELVQLTQQNHSVEIRLEGWTLMYHLSWAFYLNLAGCLATIVATVQTGLYNVPLRQPDDIPFLNAGGDDTDPGIVTDPSAYPPPYYVLFPPMFDHGSGGGAELAKPSDVVAAAAAGLGPDGDDTPPPPSYEVAISNISTIATF